MMTKFNDIANPADEEIRMWAYESGGEYPEEMSQDWDLIVAEYGRLELIAKIANDTSCATKDFFLACLYLLSGQCVRYPERIDSANADRIRSFILSQKHTFHDRVSEWAERSLALFDKPDNFDYGKWCGGGYAYIIEDKPQETPTFLERLRGP